MNAPAKTDIVPGTVLQILLKVGTAQDRALATEIVDRRRREDELRAYVTRSLVTPMGWHLAGAHEIGRIMGWEKGVLR